MRKLSEEERKARKKAREKAYYAAHKDKVKKRNKAWATVNKKKVQVQKKIYRAANKEKISEGIRAWKIENEEKVKADAGARYIANKEKMNAQSKAWGIENKERASELKRRHNLKKFGITIEDYEKMLVEQRGCCKICGKMPGKKRLAVDHNHETREVRALLCDRCNRMIGFAEEEPTILRLAALYIEENN